MKFLRVVAVLAAVSLGAQLIWAARLSESGQKLRDLQRTRAAGKFVLNRWERISDLPLEVAIYDTVFWEPADTDSLRSLIRTTDLVKGKSVLEIGTGSGLISLCCLNNGANRVVATDINPAAVLNARHNASRLDPGANFEARLVDENHPGAFAVIPEGERFDLIISNPPWEDGTPASVGEYSLYDPGFELLESLLAGAKEHLQPGGRMLLAYGCTAAIRRLIESGPEHGFEVRVLDERRLEDLEPVFLPGMLLELTPIKD
jgi:SAM-dependent methyltransferase